MAKSKKRSALAAIGSILLIGSVGAVFLQGPVAPDRPTQQREKERTPASMVYVPGGGFLSGSDDTDADEDVRPQKRVFVASFYMDRTEVTNAEYRRFRPSHTFPPGEANLPVTNVTYAEAEAYARWAGKRLPTEAEWEKAARGTDGRRYPWGEEWDTKRVAKRVNRQLPEKLPETKQAGVCAVFPSRVQPVGSLPTEVSPYGCLDMAGNAWEWVQGFYNGNPEQRILRGGAVGYGERAHRTYLRAIEGAGVT